MTPTFDHPILHFVRDHRWAMTPLVDLPEETIRLHFGDEILVKVRQVKEIREGLFTKRSD
ncbi:MAG: hypothetical protein ACYCQJ_14345 [Nitrososphaerales archaeon]